MTALASWIVVFALVPAYGGQSSAAAPAQAPRLTGAYVAALRAAGADPQFGLTLRRELAERLPAFSNDPARALPAAVEAAREVLRMPTGAMTARQAADIAGLYLTANPGALVPALPAFAALAPAALGEIAAFDAAPRQAAPVPAERMSQLLGSLFDGATPSGLPWSGRTLVADLGDGSAVAIKLRKPSERPGQLDDEARIMKAVDFLGPSISRPIENGAGRYEMEFHGEQSGIAYTAPVEFFKYLNDPLPGATPAERQRVLRDSALHAVDQMVALAERGFYHESLAAISHSEARWRWNYFRWTNTRFGPTPIHDWLNAFKYPNLRVMKSGLADFGHVVSLQNAAGDIARSMEGQSFQESKAIDEVGGFDPEHTLVGQNLTEWSLIVLHSALVNGVREDAAAEIVLEGFKRYVTRRAGVNVWQAMSEPAMREHVRATARYLRLMRGPFRFVSAVAAVFNGGMPGLPGEATQALLTKVVWPLTEGVIGRRVLPKDATADPPPLIWFTLGVRNFFLAAIASGLIAGAAGMAMLLLILPGLYAVGAARRLSKAAGILNGRLPAVSHHPLRRL